MCVAVKRWHFYSFNSIFDFAQISRIKLEKCSKFSQCHSTVRSMLSDVFAKCCFHRLVKINLSIIDNITKLFSFSKSFWVFFVRWEKKWLFWFFERWLVCWKKPNVPFAGRLSTLTANVWRLEKLGV